MQKNEFMQRLQQHPKTAEISIPAGERVQQTGPAKAANNLKKIDVMLVLLSLRKKHGYHRQQNNTASYGTTTPGRKTGYECDRKYNSMSKRTSNVLLITLK